MADDSVMALPDAATRVAALSARCDPFGDCLVEVSAADHRALSRVLMVLEKLERMETSQGYVHCPYCRSRLDIGHDADCLSHDIRAMQQAS